MADRILQFLDSEDDQSDFEGFNESDIEMSLHSESSSSEDDEIGNNSSDDENLDPNLDGWTRQFSPITVEQFNEQTGPDLPADFDVQTAKPIDYFWLLFSPELVTNITRHTNNYARWKMETTGEEDPRWSECTDAEIRAFLGINILMGVNQVPEVNHYWSSNPCIGNVGVQNAMTCNRFQKLNQYFHVSDRSAEPARNIPDRDRLYKVRPVIDHVLESYPQFYNLSRDVAVDEAMVRYTGRLSFRQYMPAKPIKRGIKIWMLCDSNTAYLTNFDVYLGRQNNETEHGLGYNVVSKLTENLHHTYRHVYFDNFFTSIPLATALLRNGLYSCGTVRMNRKGFPATLKKPADVKERGTSKMLQKGATNLTASVWKDKKLVYHLSTLSEPGKVVDAQRRVGRNVLHLQQPESVHQYNKNMGGVDLHDQYRMKYDVGRNSKKWWRYLFWFLVNCTIVNAFILYKLTSRRHTSKKRYRHVDFRFDLITEMIGGYTKRKRGVIEQDNPGVVSAENIQGHIHGRLPGKKRRCRYHAKVLNERTETVYGCTVCNVHLCRDGCHARYHNQQ